MKILTIMGTRPEIIRLSATISLLDLVFDHKVLFTGQNTHPNLSQNIFSDLGMRLPNYSLSCSSDSLGAQLSDIMRQSELILDKEKPNAVVILGDTNSALVSILASRKGIPVYHLEAGNRCFDGRVPEETNRRIVDHVSDFNLVYTEHARRNLLKEGLPEKRIIKTGSPMKEVLRAQSIRIKESTALKDLSLKIGEFGLASFHRQENVNDEQRLARIVKSVSEVGLERNKPVLVSTHPRTRQALDKLGVESPKNLVYLDPMLFTDFISLQKAADFVISDSGTISEESSILGFDAITPRPLIERKEAFEPGVVPTVSLDPKSMLTALELLKLRGSVPKVAEYEVDDFSRRVATFISSTVYMVGDV